MVEAIAFSHVFIRDDLYEIMGTLFKKELMSQSMKGKGVRRHEEDIRVSESRLMEYIGALWWDRMVGGRGVIDRS